MKTTNRLYYVNCFLVLLLCINVKFAKCFTSTEITLTQGRVKGTLMSRNDHPYITFFGIPYAIVSERFQEPGEPPTWNGTLIANRGTILCTQYSSSSGGTIGQEDCLVVNIYAPLNKYNEPLPVIAFIEGGAFSHGSNSNTSYDGKFLVKKNVVVVTINYRIGAFGFLCLRNKGAPGNMGLKDQIASLRWIKNNIAKFGGDPNKVTLYGQSVGSISVGYLLFSATAKGLFNRVIMSSGGVLAPHGYDEDPIKSASTAALRLGYDTMDPEQLAIIYKNATANDLAQLYNITITTVLDQYVFRPCLEDSSVSEQAVITEPVLDLFRAFRVDPTINVITGYLNEEGMTQASNYNSTGIKDIDRTISTLVPHNFQFKSQRAKSLFVEEVKHFYFRRTDAYDNLYDQLVDYISDAMYIYPEFLTAVAFLRSNNTMYNYFFTFDSDRNFAKFTETKYPLKPGADHADDLFYIFDALYKNRPLPLSPIDRAVINAITTMWTDFARTGVPSSRHVPWIASRDTLKFLRIDRVFAMIPLPYQDRMLFWNIMHEKYCLPYINVI